MNGILGEAMKSALVVLDDKAINGVAAPSSPIK
jgi:hypothetical protein